MIQSNACHEACMPPFKELSYVLESSCHVNGCIEILAGGLRGALTHWLHCYHSGICQVLWQGSVSAAVHPPCILDTLQARWQSHSADLSTAAISPVAAAVQDDTISSRQILSDILSLASTSHSQAAYRGMESAYRSFQMRASLSCIVCVLQQDLGQC